MLIFSKGNNNSFENKYLNGIYKKIIIEQDVKIVLPTIYQPIVAAQVSVRNYTDNMVTVPVIIW
jgi:hypothetical protein